MNMPAPGNPGRPPVGGNGTVIPMASLGHVVAVMGGKGGVGKSVLAANIAIAFQTESKQKTFLLDCDSRSAGDQRVILSLQEKPPISELIQKQIKLDDATIQKTFIAHKCGLMLGSAATAPEDFERMTKEEFDPHLKQLMRSFQVTVVDCGSELNDIVLAVLERASLILVVTAPDVLVLNQTEKLCNKLQSLLFPVDMVRVVLNRFSNSSGIQPAMVQNKIKRQLLAALPEDEVLCAQALTRGQPFLLAAPTAEVSKQVSGLVRNITSKKLLEQLALLKKPQAASLKAGSTTATGALKATGTDGVAVSTSSSDRKAAIQRATKDPRAALKLYVHDQLQNKMDMKKMDTESDDPQKKMILYEKTKKVVLDILEAEDHPYKQRDDLFQLVKEILDEALRLGPLEDLLNDPTVSEIMVNRADQIYIERGGKPGLSKVTFSGNQQVLQVIERIVNPIGRRIDQKSPYVDGRLADGSRVHAIIPPLAISGPTITIRKFPSKRLGIQDLVKFGSMTEEMGDFLRACVEAHLNVVISGGTGSGKTTLLNVMTSFIQPNERIITVEDAAELQILQDHWVRLETRPKNIEGEGEVTIRDLVKQCLRMRPDRVVVGEIRDGAALDMVQAMNTGHDGSLTTVHANTPRDAVRRLETLVMMAGMDMPATAIREQISSAVHLIVQQSRLTDGSRKVMYITELTGMQGDVVTMQDVFIYKQTGIKDGKVQGKFQATGFIPKFVQTLEAKGIKIPKGLFSVT